jgi:hypothetical protein
MGDVVVTVAASSLVCGVAALAREAPIVNWKSATDASPMRRQCSVFDATCLKDIHPPGFFKNCRELGLRVIVAVCCSSIWVLLMEE